MSKVIKDKRFSLTNNQLKIIAMISMLIDHTGLMFFPHNPIFRIIGRISFPIFAYMIAEGCQHTKNRKRYLGTISAMALLFQVVNFLFANDLYQSIFYTFALSIAIIFSIDSFINNKNAQNRALMILILVLLIFIGVGCPLIFKSSGFAVDYGVWGIFLPVLIYFAPSKKHKLIFTALLIIAMSIISSRIQWWALFAIPLLVLYNGRRGKRNLKYLFYVFYPAHLVLLTTIYLLLVMLDIL